MDTTPTVNRYSEIDNIHNDPVFNQDAIQLGKKHTSTPKYREGDKAPNFILLNTENQYIDLYQTLKSKRAVLIIYRGSWCTYCNNLLLQFQKKYKDIMVAGATVMAISPQTPDASSSIKNHNGIEYEVLSDNGNIVAQQFTTTHKMSNHVIDRMTELGIEYDSYYSDENSELPISAVFIIEKDSTISFAKTVGGDYRKRINAQDVIVALQSTII